MAVLYFKYGKNPENRIKITKMKSQVHILFQKVCLFETLIVILQRQNPPRLFLMRTRAGLFCIYMLWRIHETSYINNRSDSAPEVKRFDFC